MKTILRRLQQLEQRKEAEIAVNDASGAKERLIESVNRLAERLRADSNWKPMPTPTVAQVREIQEALARHASEAEAPRVVRRW